MRLPLFRRMIVMLAGVLAVCPLWIGQASAGPQPQVTGWSATGALSVPRERAAAVLLNSGNVLMMGGRNCGTSSCAFFASSEIYNPATGSWSAGPSMSTARTDFKAVLLGNGKVLAIGGADGSGDQSADLYNPATNTFSSGGTFSLAMDSGFQAVVLNSGKVLVVGGCCGGAPYNQLSVIYNPATNTWSNGPSLSTSRYSPTASLLSNGKVLVAGGLNSAGTVLTSTELYNPATNSFSPGPSMFDGRWSAQAAVMPNGQVLLLGGVGTSGCFGASEVYNPTSNSFTNHVTGLKARSDQTATLIVTNNGNMLAAGGNCSLKTAALYNFSLNTWSTAAAPTVARRDEVLVRLRSGLILQAGGDNFSTSLKTASLYTPETATTAFATPNPVIRGTIVTLAGSGFRSGETVRFSNAGVVFANGVADALGNVTATFNTSSSAAKFYIDKAVGVTSGSTAYFLAPIVTA